MPVSLYFELQQAQGMPPSSPPAMSPLTIAAPGSALRQHRRLWEEGYAVKSDSPEWDMSIAKLASWSNCYTAADSGYLNVCSYG
jgi:hypothetical protein